MGYTATIVGDSHAKFFFANDLLYQRLGLDPAEWDISGRAISAASLAGFRKKASTVDARKYVMAQLPRAKNLVLAFGQVDTELGYYYRLLRKHEDVTPDTYVRWLTEVFEKFLDRLHGDLSGIVLKGVNLTTFASKAFFLPYVSRIINPQQEPDLDAAAVSCALLSEDAQNDMHLAFNERLRALANARGLRYFDINSELAALGGSTVSKLPATLQGAGFDHHIADTLAVRKIHFEALARVLGPAD